MSARNSDHARSAVAKSRFKYLRIRMLNIKEEKKLSTDITYFIYLVDELAAEAHYYLNFLDPDKDEIVGHAHVPYELYVRYEPCVVWAFFKFNTRLFKFE